MLGAFRLKLHLMEIVKLDSGCSGAVWVLTDTLAFSQGSVRRFPLTSTSVSLNWRDEVTGEKKKKELILLLFPFISLFGSGEHRCWLVMRTSCSFSLAVAGVGRLQVPRMAAKLLCPVLLAASVDRSGGHSYSVGIGGWSPYFQRRQLITYWGGWEKLWRVLKI